MIKLERILKVQNHSGKIGAFGKVYVISKELLPFVGQQVNVKVTIETPKE